MKKIIFWIAMPAIIILHSCSSSKSETDTVESDVIPVKIISLEPGTADIKVQTSGVFTTDDETFLSFKTGGIIRSILVQEGDFVKQGQVLATLEMTEINAGLQQATLAHEKALRDYSRVKNLYTDSVTTLEQLQNAKTALELATRQLEAAQFNVRFSTIRANVNGYVLKKFVNEGQLIGPGNPVLQVNGAGKGDWMLTAGVSDAEWASIETGDAAIIATDADPDVQLKAKVSLKSEGVDANSGTFMIRLKLIDKPSTEIAAGMFGKAEIIASRKRNGWIIPFEALLDSDGKKAYVFVTNDKQQALKQEVVVEHIENGSVLISHGLENVRYMIVSGNAYLMDKSKIKITE